MLATYLYMVAGVLVLWYGGDTVMQVGALRENEYPTHIHIRIHIHTK